MLHRVSEKTFSINSILALTVLVSMPVIFSAWSGREFFLYSAASHDPNAPSFIYTFSSVFIWSLVPYVFGVLVLSTIFVGLLRNLLAIRLVDRKSSVKVDKTLENGVAA